MRKIVTSAALLLALLPLTSCDDDGTEPEVSERFEATLTGGAEVPPRTTSASGTAVFELNRAGTEIDYTLTVANIQGMVQAHIHVGQPGANGPIVVFLFGPHGAPGVSSASLVKTGTITAADINPANFAGTFADLLTQIRSGGTYVNAHTTTFPGGEVRGQIAPAD